MTVRDNDGRPVRIPIHYVEFWEPDDRNDLRKGYHLRAYECRCRIDADHPMKPTDKRLIRVRGKVDLSK